MQTVGLNLLSIPTEVVQDHVPLALLFKYRDSFFNIAATWFNLHTSACAASPVAFGGFTA